MSLNEAIKLLRNDPNVAADFRASLRAEDVWLRRCPTCGGHRVTQQRFGALLRPSTCHTCRGSGQQLMVGDAYGLKAKERVL